MTDAQTAVPVIDPVDPVGPEVHPAHMRLALLALAVGGFAIGTTEFVTMGLLPQVADGVGVSIPDAGHLISAYALGVVVGAPVLAFFGAKWPRRGLLLALMTAYAVFNALSAVATSYHLLMAARFLDGLPHGAYFGVASLVAADARLWSSISTQTVPRRSAMASRIRSTGQSRSILPEPSR